MPKRRTGLWLFCLVVGIAATSGCAKSTTPSEGGTADGGARDGGARDSGARDGGARDSGARDGGARDAGGRDAGPATACPATAPSDASSCHPTGLVCEYGDDPRESCRVRATCMASGWSIDNPSCMPPPTVMCPATRADASGTDCTADGAVCSYADGLSCFCTSCPPGSPVCGGSLKWYCPPANPDAQCPATMPNLGTACSPQGKSCRYQCGPGGARMCTGGMWVEADGGPCPVSTRRAKRDIHYLAPAQVREVARAVERMRLAHYDYRDPAIDRRHHLGVILEDLPQGSPAADRQARMIDVYGYASMLVAATQAQQRQIDALDKEVARLRARLDHQESGAAHPGHPGTVR